MDFHQQKSPFLPLTAGQNGNLKEQHEEANCGPIVESRICENHFPFSLMEIYYWTNPETVVISRLLLCLLTFGLMDGSSILRVLEVILGKCVNKGGWYW